MDPNLAMDTPATNYHAALHNQSYFGPPELWGFYSRPLRPFEHFPTRPSRRRRQLEPDRWIFHFHPVAAEYRSRRVEEASRRMKNLQKE